MEIARRINLFLLVFLLLSSYPVFGVEREIKLEDEEAYVLLDSLLGLSSQPITVREEFHEYKKWAKIYKKYAEKKELSSSEMKIYLYIVFTAHKRVMVHTQEEIIEEIMMKFEKQPLLFLNVLRELPFLAPTAFISLSDHFLLNVPTKEKKQRVAEFVDRYGETILEYLGQELGSECIYLIRDPSRRTLY